MFAVKTKNIEDYKKRKIKVLNNVFASLELWANKDVSNEIVWKKEFETDMGDFIRLKEQKFGGEHCTIMPVSAMTCSATIEDIYPETMNDEFLGNTSGYTIKGNAKLHPIGKEIRQEPTSSLGNERMFALMIGNLRGPEILRQMKRLEVNKNKIEKFLPYAKAFREWAYLTELHGYNHAIEVASDPKIEDHVIENVLHYIIMHKTRSFISGVKWEIFLFYDLTKGTIDMDSTRPWVKRLIQVEIRRWNNLRLFMMRNRERMLYGNEIACFLVGRNIVGGRTRAGKMLWTEVLPDDNNSKDNKYKLEEKVYRMRWVIGIFGIGHKRMVFSDEENEMEDRNAIAQLQILCTFTIISPITEKGNIWLKVQELFEQYGAEGCFVGDGTGWETVVSVLLHPFGCIWLGFAALASGIADTSILGIGAMMLVIQVSIFLYNTEVEVVSGFGDNVLVCGKFHDIEGLITSEQDEKQYVIYLGVSIVIHRVMAFKLFRDDANKDTSTNLSSLKNLTMYDKVDLDRRIATYITYGKQNIVDLLDLLSGYKGGGNMEKFIVSTVRKLKEEVRMELISFDDRVKARYWNERYII